MQIINLTPHAIHLYATEGGLVCTLEPEPNPARAKEIVALAGYVEGFPVVRKSFGAVENLPEPATGVVYIVSIVVAQAARDNGRPTHDLLLPHDLVRDDAGRIIGCRGFSLA